MATPSIVRAADPDADPDADPELQEDRLVRYQEELPVDREKTWKLLSEYSKIPSSEIEAHLRSVRDRAWRIFPYGCIGAWRFLDLYLTSLPTYPAVVQRLRAGDHLLDAGCCFGYVLRQLAADGVPGDHLAGADLHPEFVHLGYELFRDRDTFPARFVTGDMVHDTPGSDLTKLDGLFDIVHAASFFHLFDWDDQVRVGERVVRFFRPASERTAQGRQEKCLLFGRQIGSPNPIERPSLIEVGRRRFHHNPASLQKIWDEIGQKTGTRWHVDADVALSTRPGEGERGRHIIHFAITRLD